MEPTYSRFSSLIYIFVVDTEYKWSFSVNNKYFLHPFETHVFSDSISSVTSNTKAKSLKNNLLLVENKYDDYHKTSIISDP